MGENLGACPGDEALHREIHFLLPHAYIIYLFYDIIQHIAGEVRTRMARQKANNVQINISIPAAWKSELENLARIYSVEEGHTVTFLDLMRRGIREKYQLEDKPHDNG